MIGFQFLQQHCRLAECPLEGLGDQLRLWPLGSSCLLDLDLIWTKGEFSGEYFGNFKLSFKKSLGKTLSFSLSFGEAGKCKLTLEQE